MITLTRRAAQKIASAVRASGEEEKQGLRINIVYGECSSGDYEFKLDAPKQNDCVFVYFGATVMTDEENYERLRGAEIDYVDDQYGSRFVVQKPGAKGEGCCGPYDGCGEEKTNVGTS